MWSIAVKLLLSEIHIKTVSLIL